VEGLALGPRPEGGVFEGTLFLHPELGFQIRFPDGWRLQNSPRAVGAMSPHRDAIVYLTADMPPGGLQEAAESFVTRELQGRARVRDSQPVKLGSLDAWRLEATTPSAAGSTDVLSTFFTFRDATWRITGLAPSGVAERHRGRILATSRSFRPIDREQAARIAPTRLQVVTARAGEDIETLSTRTGNTWSAVRTAVLNGLESHHRFVDGDPVKIAVTGR
jgi:predicted Zn-dependent protease